VEQSGLWRQVVAYRVQRHGQRGSLGRPLASTFGFPATISTVPIDEIPFNRVEQMSKVNRNELNQPWMDLAAA
jgi:hypothetical protein